MYKQLGAEHFVKIEEKPKQEISHKMRNDTSRFWLGFLIGVITTIVIIYLFKEYFCAVLLWLVLRGSMIA